MFLFLSLQSEVSGLFSRRLARSIFYLCVLLCLSTAFLFTGCSTDVNDVGSEGLDSRLIGKWKSPFDEIYVITQTNLSYESEYSSWSGRIMYAANFNDNTGILIIQYDEDKKQQWTNWDTLEDITPMNRDFYGIYFRNLTQNSVVLSNTSDQANNWGPSETATLAQAKSRFTLDKMPDWIDLSFAAPLDRVPQN